MKRVHIIGRKNSGKTTLIVELVQALSLLGLRVGTIKHTHHQHELDVPGKDSFRHREAGASAVGIVSPGMHAVFLPYTDRPVPEGDPYSKLAPMFDDCDVVLVEGDINTQAPRVEVWRREASEAMIAEGDENLAAVVTDDKVTASCPVWPRSNVEGIAEKLLDLLGIKGD